MTAFLTTCRVHGSSRARLQHSYVAGIQSATPTSFSLISNRNVKVTVEFQDQVALRRHGDANRQDLPVKNKIP